MAIFVWYNGMIYRTRIKVFGLKERLLLENSMNQILIKQVIPGTRVKIGLAISVVSVSHWFSSATKIPVVPPMVRDTVPV